MSLAAHRLGSVAREAAVVVLLALTLACASATAAPAGSAAAGRASRVVVLREDPSEVRDYWTARRMRAARPAGLLLHEDGRVTRAAAGRGGRAARRQGSVAEDASASSSSFPGRVHGKVFVHFEDGSQPGDFVCSGTAVDSNRHAVVLTAGHCVDDAQFGGGFATAWMFIPGYRNGQRPFGSWTADKLITTDGWRQEANLRVDIGAAILDRDAQGRGIEDVVGGRSIAFDQPRAQTYTAFGYPAQANLLSLPPRVDFDGQRLYRCSSELIGTDPSPPGEGPDPSEIACDMTGGASGGGWVGDGGALLGLTSYGYSDDGDHLYGPYLGAAAESVYRKAAGPSLRCGGHAVTNLGGAGAQRYRGTSGDEVFKLGGGADRAAAGGGDDLACGGGARDRLRGDGGADRLRGGAGPDLLVGGPGRDLCAGGPGRDRAIGCERRQRIP